jgi:glycosyltransferase involved in cell wall biosynthesis
MSVSKSPSSHPLVSVIVPVRNGAATLQFVLDGLLRQSYDNLEILVSDNESTDRTAEVCAAAVSDSRVRVVRQASALTAIANFKYWLPFASGRYVIFAAHDDLRDVDFVKELVAVAQRSPEAVCVLPSVWTFSQYGTDPFTVESPIKRSVEHFATDGLGQLQRFGFALANGYHMYGLMRADAVVAYPWYEIDYAPDAPFVLHLAMTGEIVLADSARLFSWIPEKPKSPHERARANSLHRLRPFPELRLAWVNGKAASLAQRRKGHYLPVVLAMFLAYFVRRTAKLKMRLNQAAPAPLRQKWRELKARFGWRLN